MLLNSYSLYISRMGNGYFLDDSAIGTVVFFLVSCSRSIDRVLPPACASYVLPVLTVYSVLHAVPVCRL